MKPTKIHPPCQNVLAGLVGVLLAYTGVVGADLDPVLTGTWPPSGPSNYGIRSVSVVENHVYLACGGKGLQVLDVSDPSQPRRVGQYWPLPPWDRVEGVAVSGDHAYLATYTGLQVIDISDPARPRRVDPLPEDTGSYADIRSVTVANGHAYLFSFSGLTIFDISQPSNPIWKADYPSEYSAYAAASGSYAYLVSGEGLEIVDLSSPARPRRISFVDLSGLSAPRAVAVASGHVFVADSDTGLQVVDVTDPTQPRSVGAYPAAGLAGAISMIGHHALLGIRGWGEVETGLEVDNGLVVFDISDPTDPRPVGAYATGLQASSITVRGTSCYLASSFDEALLGPRGGFLEILNVADPAQPQRLAKFVDEDQFLGQDVALADNHAYIADTLAGLRIIDVSNPARPNSAGQVDVGRNARRVAVSGNRACVIDQGGWGYGPDQDVGLRVVDVADPAHPVVLGHYSTKEPAEDLAIVGDHVYLTFASDSEEGLQVIDISDPARPRRTAYDNTGFAAALAVAGNYAYVAAGGLMVFDVTNPADPVKVGFVAMSDARSIAVSGHYACVMDWFYGLQIVDISDPGHPKLLGVLRHGGGTAVAASGNRCLDLSESAIVDFSDPWSPRRVGSFDPEIYAVAAALSGNYAYLVGTSFSVIDIGKLANPQRVGSNPSLAGALDVKVSGQYAYLASGSQGLYVVDLTNPIKPSPVGTVDTSGFASGLTVSGAYAYVADGEAGLQVIDISNPAAPRRVGGSATAGNALHVAVSGHHAFVACGSPGIQVLDISNPLDPQGVGIYRNGWGWVDRVSVSGDRAYLFGTQFGTYEVLEALDVSDSANPRTAGKWIWDLPSPLGIPTSVPTIYIEDPNELWLVSDNTFPENPQLIGGLRTIAAGRGVVLAGQYAYRPQYEYAYGRQKGLQVFDLSDVAHPKLVGRSSIFSGGARAVAVSYGRIYVADNDWREGLVVLEMLPFIKSISRNGSELQLNWEGWGRARLQGTDDLLSSGWQELEVPASANSVSLPATGSPAFFRLFQP